MVLHQYNEQFRYIICLNATLHAQLILTEILKYMQDGVPVTGVTIAFTVRAMDAGPIITSESVEIDDHIKVLLISLW